MRYPFLPLFSGGLMLAACAAHAQLSYALDLGDSANSSVSGTATLAASTSTVGGVYQYYDGDGQPTPFPTNGYVLYLTTYGPSTADIAGATLIGVKAFNTSTINVSSGGIIGRFAGEEMEAHDHSVVNFSGGGMEEVHFYDNSTFNMSGGEIDGPFGASGSCVVNLSGGYIGYDGDFGGHVAVTFSGGGASALNLGGFSTLTMTGGNAGPVRAYDDVTVTMSGGTVQEFDFYGSGTSSIKGGTVGFVNNYAGILNVYGYGLTQTLVSDSDYLLTGTLENGDTLNAEYEAVGGTLNLINLTLPVPEASSSVSLGLLLGLGFGGMALARRRKCAPIS